MIQLQAGFLLQLKWLKRQLNTVLFEKYFETYYRCNPYYAEKYYLHTYKVFLIENVKKMWLKLNMNGGSTHVRSICKF